MPAFAQDGTEASMLLAQMLTFLRGKLRRHHSAQDQPVLKASNIKASAGPEVTCPPSHPQDLRAEYGEGGPLAQVTWRHNTWPIANSLPPVLSPGPRPPSEAFLSGYQERHLDEFPALLLSQGRELKADLDSSMRERRQLQDRQEATDARPPLLQAQDLLIRDARYAP